MSRPGPDQHIKRTVGSHRRLLAAQISASLALPAGATASGLLAVEIAGPTAAALPLAVLVAGSGVAALAASALTARSGRRAGLLGAYAAAVLGSLLTVVAAAASSLTLLLLASALFGAGNAAAMLTRYAAADLVDPAHRGRALSRMLLALTLGAVIVPNLLDPAARLARPLGLPAATGLFLLATAALLIAGALLPPLPPAQTRVDSYTKASDDDDDARSPDGHPGPLRGALGPLAVLAGANLAMVTVMAVVPPLLHVHGASLSQVGLLVSAHVAAMYAPAALAGRAVDRYGARRTALAGTVLMLAAAGLGLPKALTHDPAYAAIVLLLVGLAWSIQVVGGSTWLTHTLPSTTRARAEGVGEAGMATAAATGGFSAAPLLAFGGSSVLLGAVLMTTAVTAAVVLAQRPPPQGAR